MGEPLRLILLLIPLIAGAMAIFLSFRMMKRYDVPFVSSYFYYLVFLYIFGSYSLAGSGILEHLLARMEIDVRVIHTSRLFSILLGIPFLILSKFMFLRSILEYFNKSMTRLYTSLYFTPAVLGFILYGFFAVRFSRFERGDYQLLFTIQRWVFLGYMAFIYLNAFITAFHYSNRMTDHNRKRFIRSFTLWYLLYMILSCALLALIPLHILVRHLLVIILLSWHLIPLLFLNLYLEKYHGKVSELQQSFDEKLELFSDRFEISKREKEVIRLICQGLTNQEIGDALFISLQTVKDHTHRIFLKTGVKNRVQLSNLIRS